MVCKNCGSEVVSGANVCPNCGTPIANEQPPVQNINENPAPNFYPNAPAPVPGKTLGIVSLILSIVSVVFACCYGFGIIFAIAGVICGILGMKQAKQVGEKNTLAMVGAIISGVFILINIIVLVVMIIGIMSTSMSSGYYY